MTDAVNCNINSQFFLHVFIKSPRWGGSYRTENIVQSAKTERIIMRLFVARNNHVGVSVQILWSKT